MSRPQLSRNEFSAIFSDDVELMEVRYSEPSIYKYFYFPDPVLERTFFARPTIKFTHKDDLNDPFELSRRWVAFGCPITKDIFDKYIRQRIARQFGDVRVIRREMQAYMKKSDPPMSRAERRRIISSKVNRRAIAKQWETQRPDIDLLEAMLPWLFQGREDEFIEKFARETGILSLTDAPNDLRMWNEYAGNGKGFVVEFDAQHDFFMHVSKNGRVRRKLIRKVFYRDERIEDFWKNPFYLFLVKEMKWSYEKEWRVLRKLDDCREITTESGQIFYIADVPAGLIKSVTFGHRFPSSRTAEYGSLLKEFDSNIKIARNIEAK